MPRSILLAVLMCGLALVSACDPPPESPGETQDKGEPARVDVGDARPVGSPDEAPDEAAQGECDDPSKPPVVACSVPGAGKVRCCLEGCASGVSPLDKEAFTILTDPGGPVDTTATVDGACLDLSPGVQGEEEAPTVLGVSVAAAALPQFKESPIALKTGLARFYETMWWCAPDRLKSCKAMVTPRGDVKLLVLHETPLLPSEARRTERLRDKLASRLKTTVHLDDVPAGPRHDRLVTWLDTLSHEERQSQILDDVVLHDDLTIVLRWPQPRVEKARTGEKHFSRGITGVAMVQAEPRAALREIFWTNSGLRGNWGPRSNHWFEGVVEAAHLSLLKEARTHED